LNCRDKGKDTTIDVTDLKAIGVKKFGTRISNLEIRKELKEDEELKENEWLVFKPYQSIVGIKMHFDSRFGNLYGCQFKIMQSRP